MIFQLVLFHFPLLTDSFFFDLPGLSPGPVAAPPPPQQCCCQQQYAPPPPPPPVYAPPQSYAPYRNRRKRSATRDLEASTKDSLCNSPAVRNIMQNALTNNPDESRLAISSALRAHMEGETVVVCSPLHFDFTASRDSEFCSVPGSEFICHAFLF